MTSSPNQEANQDWILETLNHADLESLDYIFFPENSLNIRVSEGEATEAISINHPFFETLKGLAQSKELKIHFSTPIWGQDSEIYNSSFWVTSQGIEGVYNKIHLFKYQSKNNVTDEASSFHPGDRPSIFSDGSLKFGSGICFDLRFSNLFEYYARQDIDVLLVPSAFFPQTGKDHWECLLRARAIESQAFVVASGQTGIHKNSLGGQRVSYGHSLVIDPWGNIVLDAGIEEGLYSGYIHKDMRELVKAKIPMKRSF